jgi:putative transferase (TIGR04331 family)
VENILNHIPFPKSPKKIFTSLGFNRSTIMDRYISRKLENGSLLILAQHGGNYFQHKFHYDTIYEPNISDKYLTWGNVNQKNTTPVGILKKLNNTKFNPKKIILEVRMRKGYSRLKIDSGYLENKKYIEELCKFFKSIRNSKINRNLYVKLHSTKWLWNEKKQFERYNPNLKFLDEKKKMIDEMNSAKLIIHTFCSTGHLESLAANIPTVILFTNDIKFYDKKSNKYFFKFKKNGILHTNNISLFKFLNKIDTKEKINQWWGSKKIQNLLDNYRHDYAFFNNNKIKNLFSVIRND